MCAWNLGGDGIAAIDDGKSALACTPRLPALPSAESPHGEPSSLGGGRFRLGLSAGHGHFGDVWQARLMSSNQRYVLKRVSASAGPAALRAAAREAFFGATLKMPSAARFVENFTVSNDTWLVFHHGGSSLAAMLYSIAESAQLASVPAGGLAVLSPSPWWREQRASASGSAQLRAIWRGVLRALADAHALGIAHRDVKPGNVLVDGAGAVRLCDWGSAISDTALEGNLYNPAPSAAEETEAYAPPEAKFGGVSWHSRMKTADAISFDIFSAGVLGLELLCLGTPDVFQPHTKILKAERIRALAAAAGGLMGVARDYEAALRAFASLCVQPPQVGAALADAETCSERSLLALLRFRDPAAGGQALSPWGLRLIRRMLSWDPLDRPSAAKALRHAFFRDAGGGFPCADGTDAEWQDDCL